jgi:hypothetical protein
MFISSVEKRINNIAFPIILISSFVTTTLTELNHGTGCSNTELHPKTWTVINYLNFL